MTAVFPCINTDLVEIDNMSFVAFLERNLNEILLNNSFEMESVYVLFQMSLAQYIPVGHLQQNR